MNRVKSLRKLYKAMPTLRELVTQMERGVQEWDKDIRYTEERLASQKQKQEDLIRRLEDAKRRLAAGES